MKCDNPAQNFSGKKVEKFSSILIHSSEAGMISFYWMFDFSRKQSEN